MRSQKVLGRVGLVWLLLTLATAAGRADPPVKSETSPTRVAIYDHSDGSAKGPVSLQRFLTEPAGFRCQRVRPEDIRAGCLKDYDVLIVPGGSGSKQAENLEVDGREAIRNFVRDGGGYVGICAGSYLATTHYEWSLGLLNAKVVDREHWARGTGTVTLMLSPAGRKALGSDDDEVEVFYGQGPLLAPGGQPEPGPFETLATYATEIAENGAPTGVMVGTTAIARGAFGKGRIICYSPHAEVKDGPNQLVLEGVRWATDAKQ